MKLSNEFIEKSKCNTAKVFEFFYVNNIKPSEEFLKNLDFSEEFRKSFFYTFNKKQERIDIDESVAINCIKNLDFKIIEPYFDYSWFKFGSKYDNSIIKTSIFYEKYEVLEKCLEIVKEKIQHDLIHNQKNILQQEFEKYFFRDSLDLCRNLQIAKDTKMGKDKIDFIYSYFKESIKVFEDYYNSKNKLFFNDTKNLEIADIWHKRINTIRLVFSTIYSQENLNEFLVSDKKFINIIKDINKQYKNNEKNPLAEENLLVSGLDNLNYPYIETMYKNKIVSDKDLNNAFNKLLEKYLTQFQESLFSKYNYSSVKNIDFNKINTIANFFIKHNIQFTYENKSIACLLAIDNKEIKKILDKIEDLDNKNVIQDLNIKQLSYIHDVCDKIPKVTNNEYSSEKDFIVANYPSLTSFLSFKAKQIIPDYVLSDSEREFANDFIFKNIQYLILTKENKESIKKLTEIAIQQTILEQTLNTNNNNTNTNSTKLKI